MLSFARFVGGLFLSGALVGALGCKGDSAPGCRIALSAQLAPSALTQAEDARLQRVGSGFVLAALDGDNLRWAPLDSQGTLGVESTLPLPKHAPQTAPWFGMTSKLAPGDQMIAVYLANKEGTTNQLEARAIAQLGGLAPSSSVLLFELPAGVAASAVQLAVGSSKTGQRAAVTWSVDGTAESPSLLLLGADAQPMGPPITVFKTPLTGRTCLAVIPSRTELAVAAIEPPSMSAGRAIWHGVEFRDDGSRFYDVSFELEAVPSDCPAVAPTPRGYVATYKNNDGIYFTDFDITKSVPNGDIIAGALDFGGAARIPKTACVSPMGREYALLLDRASGPEAWRVKAFGNPQGGSLLLPSTTGSVGPLSAWPGLDELYVTYVDRGRSATAGPSDGSSTGNSRSLVRVDCPMAAPYVSYEADGNSNDAGVSPDGNFNEDGK